MRECTVTSRTYACLNPNSPDSVKKEYGYVNGHTVHAWFHQFTTETDSEGVTVAMAIVEYKNGSVATVPLNWLAMSPYIVPETTVLESVSTGFMSEDLERHIKEVFNIGLHQFTMMCQNIGSRR